MKDIVALPMAVDVAAEDSFLSTLLGGMSTGKHPGSTLKASLDFKSAARSQQQVLINKSASVSALVEEQLTKVLNNEATDDAFYVADVGEVIRQHRQWKAKLPMVEPFYAVKCNPDPTILSCMVKMGISGFDCASRAEIDACLALGVDPSRIIYANPCKAASHIRHASSVGVRVMTFDNADELHKVKKYHANPQMVLRVITDDSKSVCRFGVKFGAHLGSTYGLLQLAKDLDIEVVGVSFHVGSGCTDAAAFADAIARARRVFREGAQLGHNMTLLDIGGGFPGFDACHGISFDEIASAIRPALVDQFGDLPGVRIIAEPGRYYVSSAYTLAVNIHARRVVREADKVDDSAAVASFMYYINEGLYSSLNCVYFDHKHVDPRVLLKSGAFMFGRQLDNEQTFPCSLWGPTCDSMDMVARQVELPELNVGDWLYFDAMGAYTVAAQSTFNGFRNSSVIWTNTEAATLLV